ncbi:MAG: EVE domain-containing protein [Proteobacteria bacterium]|nr:EVE domain-containing protein [Pseudomonadota bacterium]
MDTDATHWLMKSEPNKYSFADLQRDGRTNWDGVRNNQAALYLKAMKVGQLAFFYHSNVDLAVVGIARISKTAFIDPTDPAGRFVAVEVEPVAPMPTPVTLAQLKANPDLAGMTMFRQFRLSVTPIETPEWKIICAMGGYKG